MKHYVLGFVFDENLEEVILIKRKKNPYQGLLNGVGGKIELGEDRLTAMVREWKEEVNPNIVPKFHQINSTNFQNEFLLNVFCATVNKDSVSLPVEIDEGIISWHSIDKEFLFRINKHLPDDVGEYLHMSYLFLKYLNNKQ